MTGETNRKHEFLARLHFTLVKYNAVNNVTRIFEAALMLPPQILPLDVNHAALEYANFQLGTAPKPEWLDTSLDGYRQLFSLNAHDIEHATLVPMYDDVNNDWNCTVVFSQPHPPVLLKHVVLMWRSGEVPNWSVERELDLSAWDWYSVPNPYSLIFSHVRLPPAMKGLVFAAVLVPFGRDRDGEYSRRTEVDV